MAGHVPLTDSLVVCVLTARDAARELPAWLGAVAPVADAVVAMDLGSADETSDVLRAHDIVKVALHAPEASDRGLAHNRLLAAAAELRPRWVLALDVDEQVVAADADALRSFLAGDALPELAYGLRLVRAAPDRARWDLLGPVAFRLFAFSPGIRLPAGAPRLATVPTAIPPSRWLPTEFRIATTAGPADGIPDEWHGVEGTPGRYRRWDRRPAGPFAVPATALRSGPESGREGGTDEPVISVVVEGAEASEVAWTLRSVHDAGCLDPYEVVVVVPEPAVELDGADAGPTRVVRAAAGSTAVQRQRAGIDEARGEYVLALGAGATVLPGCLDAHVREHDRGHPLVAGAVLNGPGSPTAWASYFLTHSSLLAGRDATSLAAHPAGCSFSRELLDELDAHRQALQGLRAGYAADGRRIEPATQDAVAMLREQYSRGLEIARSSTDELWRSTVLGRAGARVRWLTTFGPRELARVDANVARWGGAHIHQYRRARPRVAAAVALCWAGAVAGSFRGARRRRR
jgi:hypothetical protein